MRNLSRVRHTYRAEGGNSQSVIPQIDCTQYFFNDFNSKLRYANDVCYLQNRERIATCTGRTLPRDEI